MPGPERRLAAILFSDIVGYTALMARDEGAGLRARERHRSLLGSQARRYHGEVVDENGDELVLCFPSAVEAVNCALAAQAELADDPELKLRIGIHLGDVVFEEGRVYGDGVNLASRVRPLAEPGGVCISDEVEHSVGSQSNLEAQSLGPKELKGVVRPVEVFALRGTVAEPSSVSTHSGRSRLRLLLASGGAAGAVLAAFGWWMLSVAPVAERTPPTSLVVLPFDDLSPNGDQEYFAHGMSDELINALTRVSGLDVKGRTTGRVVKSMGLDVPQIGERIGVGAVVEGSVRRLGDRLRVTVQLIEVETGFHLWSEQYERTAGDLFAVQEEIADAVAGALQARVGPARLDIGAIDPPVYDTYLHGRHLARLRTKEGLMRSVELLEDVIASAPDFAPAHAALANSIWELSGRGFMSTEKVDQIGLPRAERAVERALEIAPDDPHVLASLGRVRAFRFDHVGALRALGRAVEIDPGDADFRHWYGQELLVAGRTEEGARQYDRALQLDPMSRVVNVFAALASWQAGDLEGALTRSRRGFELERDDQVARRIYAEFLSEAGHETEAIQVYLGQALPPQVAAAAKAAAETSGLAGAQRVVADFAAAASGRPCGSSPGLTAQFLAASGLHERAIGCLQRALAQGWAPNLYLRLPSWDPLRDDPRFQAILEGMNLAD